MTQINIVNNALNMSSLPRDNKVSKKGWTQLTQVTNKEQPNYRYNVKASILHFDYIAQKRGGCHNNKAQTHLNGNVKELIQQFAGINIIPNTAMSPDKNKKPEALLIDIDNKKPVIKSNNANEKDLITFTLNDLTNFNDEETSVVRFSSEKDLINFDNEQFDNKKNELLTNSSGIISTLSADKHDLRKAFMAEMLIRKPLETLDNTPPLLPKELDTVNSQGSIAQQKYSKTQASSIDHSAQVLQRDAFIISDEPKLEWDDTDLATIHSSEDVQSEDSDSSVMFCLNAINSLVEKNILVQEED